MLTGAQWAMLESLVERCRPKGKTPPNDLRRMVEARHQRARSPDGLRGSQAQRDDREALGRSRGGSGAKTRMNSAHCGANGAA